MKSDIYIAHIFNFTKLETDTDDHFSKHFFFNNEKLISDIEEYRKIIIEKIAKEFEKEKQTL